LTWKAQIDHALLLLKLIATKIVFSSFLQDGDQSEYLLYEEDKSLVFISKGLQEEAHPSEISSPAFLQDSATEEDAERCDPDACWFLALDCDSLQCAIAP
jgi:hypothetical protein